MNLWGLYLSVSLRCVEDISPLVNVILKRWRPRLLSTAVITNQKFPARLQPWLKHTHTHTHTHIKRAVCLKIHILSSCTSMTIPHLSSREQKTHNLCSHILIIILHVSIGLLYITAFAYLDRILNNSIQRLVLYAIHNLSLIWVLVKKKKKAQSEVNG